MPRLSALTVYQPWASLIIAGAKRYEFRGWDYRARYPRIMGQRIAIHASARKMQLGEVLDIMARIADGASALDEEIAGPLLTRIAISLRRHKEQTLPLAHIVGTAIIGTPVSVTELFKHHPDSDRLDHDKFGWPLSDVRPVTPPLPMRGHQGFWPVSLAGEHVDA